MSGSPQNIIASLHKSSNGKYLTKLIQAPEADGDIIVQGNLFPRVSGQSLFLPPVGNYTVLITQNLSAKAVVVNISESLPSASEIAEEILNTEC